MSFVPLADFGAEQSVSVQGASATAVLSKLQELIQAGEKMPKCVAGITAAVAAVLFPIPAATGATAVQRLFVHVP